MGTLTDIRMACHQLAEPEFGHPADLVGWMGAMQAQDYTMSKWAVGLRLKSATIAQVNEALAKGEIVGLTLCVLPGIMLPEKIYAGCCNSLLPGSKR